MDTTASAKATKYADQWIKIHAPFLWTIALVNNLGVVLDEYALMRMEAAEQPPEAPARAARPR